MYVFDDFECRKCGHTWEEMYERGEESSVVCPSCGADKTQRLLATGNLAVFSIMSPEMQADHLRTRSAKHTAKELASTADKHGAPGIAAYNAIKNPSVGYRGSSKRGKSK